MISTMERSAIGMASHAGPMRPRRTQPHRHRTSNFDTCHTGGSSTTTFGVGDRAPLVASGGVSSLRRVDVGEACSACVTRAALFATFVGQAQADIIIIQSAYIVRQCASRLDHFYSVHRSAPAAATPQAVRPTVPGRSRAPRPPSAPAEQHTQQTGEGGPCPTSFLPPVERTLEALTRVRLESPLFGRLK